MNERLCSFSSIIYPIEFFVNTKMKIYTIFVAEGEKLRITLSDGAGRGLAPAGNAPYTFCCYN